MALCVLQRCKPRQRRLRGCHALAGKATELILPDDQAGSRPGSRPTSFASPKDVGEKRRPRRCRPAARGAHAAGAEIGKRRKLAALRQPTLLYPISAPATWRHQRGSRSKATATLRQRATATATSTQRNATQRQRQRATATVAARNVKSNRNCRCAGKCDGRCAKMLELVVVGCCAFKFCGITHWNFGQPAFSMVDFCCNMLCFLFN